MRSGLVGFQIAKEFFGEGFTETILRRNGKVRASGLDALLDAL